MTDDGWSNKPWPTVQFPVAASDDKPIAMSNDGWTGKAIAEAQVSDSWSSPLNQSLQEQGKVLSATLTGYDIGSGDATVLQKIKDGVIVSSAQLFKEGSNLIDDDKYLYFQCSCCDKLHDPHTKSFKILMESLKPAGWKLKWNTNGQGYKVYCGDCGKDVE